MEIVEALLFATNEPLPLKKMVEILCEENPSISLEEVENQLLQLEEQCKGRTYHLAKVGDGYLLRTNQEFKKYIDFLFKKKHADRLSQAALEVLSIVVFRNPITKAQIDEIRGVDSSGILQNLLERGLIQISGKLEAPGRPALYSITKEFLLYFGLSDIEEFKENK